MNPKHEAFLEQYKNNLEVFSKLKDVVLEKLSDIASSLGIVVNKVEGRVKDPKSLENKLLLKGDKYNSLADITDIVGCRVVTFYTRDIDLICAKITSIFDIDWNNSIDKRSIHNIDEFGYMSVHYICKLPKGVFYSEDCPQLNEISFEIQVRTVLQHTWATIYHDTGYKNDVEVPSEYLRSLTRLAGLLEIADESFAEIKSSLENYRKKVKELVSSGNLAEIELNKDSFEAYVQKGGFDVLTKKIASINNMDVEVVHLLSLLPIFKKVGCKTLKDLDSIVKEYSDKAYKFSIYQFEDTDIDIITSLTAPVALLLVYELSNGANEEKILSLVESIYGNRKSNSFYAKKIMSIGKTMGILKD